MGVLHQVCAHAHGHEELAAWLADFYIIHFLVISLRGAADDPRVQGNHSVPPPVMICKLFYSLSFTFLYHHYQQLAVPCSPASPVQGGRDEPATEPLELARARAVACG